MARWDDHILVREFRIVARGVDVSEGVVDGKSKRRV